MPATGVWPGLLHTQHRTFPQTSVDEHLNANASYLILIGFLLCLRSNNNVLIKSWPLKRSSHSGFLCVLLGGGLDDALPLSTITETIMAGFFLFFGLGFGLLRPREENVSGLSCTLQPCVDRLHLGGDERRGVGCQTIGVWVV
jgi:hypothetical protein